MLKILKIVFGLIASAFAIYSIITKEFAVLSPMIFFLGAMTLVVGLSELQEKRKSSAYAFFLVSGFAIFVSIFTFFTNTFFN